MGIDIDVGFALFGYRFNATMDSLLRRLIEDCYDFQDSFKEMMRTFWYRFMKVYAEKYPILEEGQMFANYGMEYAGGVYDLGLEYYNIYFGIELSDNCIEEKENGEQVFSVTLPANFKEIAAHFLAFNLKYGAEFLEDSDIKLEVVPDEEVAGLLAKHKMQVPKYAGYYQTIRVSA